ncbi:MAG TPA: hypothetical protein VL463_22290 [Kofleriaceae bacterium]|nr:hypothetical protein [Kofleriaceae bacterium]
MRASIAWLWLAAACGSGGTHTDPDGGTHGDPDASAACGAIACDDTTCGTAIDACGQPVVCDRCRFTSDPVGGVFESKVSIAIAGTDVDVGFDHADARRSGGGWTSDDVSSTVLQVAIGPDGTRWAVVESGGGIMVAHDGTNGWTSETVGGGTVYSPRLAIAADGTVYVAYGGFSGSVPEGIALARRDVGTGAWTYESVAAVNVSFGNTFVDLALAGGVPMIAWHDPSAGSLVVSTASGGGFTSETVDPNLPVGAYHDLAIAIDSSGRPHVAYRQDSPFFREIDHAVKDGGAWTLDKVLVMKHGERGVVRMAASPKGELAVGFVDELGVDVATYAHGLWFSQPALPDSSDIDVAFDASGTLYVATSDNDGVHLFTQSGRYADDYVAACTSAAAALCPQACACTGNGKCCYTGPNGTHACDDPEPFCEVAVAWIICGDASQDPAPLYACSAGTSGASCPAPGSELEMPAACPYF